MDGGTEADHLIIGCLGNDVYVVDNKGDVVTETSTLASKIDSVNSSVNFILAANVETGAETINGTGNGLANTRNGNTANNLLIGDAGNDTLAAAPAMTS